MSMTAVVTNVDATLNKFIIDGTVTLAGSYVAGGDVLSFVSEQIKSNAVPTKVTLWSTITGGNAMVLDYYKFLPGTTQANGLAQISTGGAEIGATAYATTAPCNAAGYVLHFQAEFPSFMS